MAEKECFSLFWQNQLLLQPFICKGRGLQSVGSRGKRLHGRWGGSLLTLEDSWLRVILKHLQSFLVRRVL